MFLERTRETSKRQILSLGCGCDTRPFLLRSLGKAENLAYFELDFPEITAKKVGIIRRNKELSSLLNDLKYVQGGIGLQSEGYCLLGTDLRTHETIFPLLTSYGFDPCLPTFVLAECFLVYLEPATAAAILDSFCSLSKVVIATYDPINPDDVFGRRMVENLLERGLVLPGFAGSSLDSHRDRLKIETAKAVDMNNVWDSWVSEAEKRRIDTVESLDEVEESRLLGSHYAVAWGARGTEDLCEAFDIESLDATVDDLT